MAKPRNAEAPAQAPAASPAVPSEPTAQLIDLALVDFSPTNPRKHVPPEARLLELGHSIKNTGLLNLLLLRPSKAKRGRLELVHGECRVRASRLVGLTHLPGRVLDLGDKEVLEAQLEENLRRTDLHPLEEANGYRALLEQHGYTAEQLAERIGRKKGYVYGRLKLCALKDKGALAAFEAGELDASHALLLARIPEPLQAAAFRDTRGRAYRDAAHIVQTNYMLQLSEAPFDTGAEDLVAAAGSCSACPKRTGNQRELFGDVRGADVCTDPVCFKGKAQAAFELEAAKVDAKRVVSKRTAAKLFRGRQLNYGTGFVDVDAPGALSEVGPYVYGKGADKSLRQLLRKDLPETMLAADEQGAAHHLVSKDVAREALRAAGHLKKPQPGTARSADTIARRKAARRKLYGAALVRGALEGILALPAAERRQATLEVLAAHVLEDHPHEAAEAVVLNRDENAKGLDRRSALRRLVKAADEQERLTIALELALRAGLGSSWERQLARPQLALGIKLAGTTEAKLVAKAAKAAKGAKAKAKAKAGA